MYVLIDKLLKKYSEINNYKICKRELAKSLPTQMKLNNCRSEKFLSSNKQKPSPEDSLTEDSP